MSGYAYQTCDRDASVSVDKDLELLFVVIEVAAGSCVTVQLPLYEDEVRGLIADLTSAADAIHQAELR